MKKLILATLSVLAVNCLNAQTTDLNVTKTEVKKTREENVEAKAQREVDALNKELTLNDEQKLKAHDFIVTKINKQKELRAKYGSSRDEASAAQRSAELQAIKDEFKANMKSILTPEQFEKFSTPAKQQQQ